MANTNSPDGLNGDEPLLALDPDIVADDQALAETVDALILHLDHHDPELVLLREELLLQQAILHDVACDATWGAYLQVEQAGAARVSELVVKIAKWAFNEGVRHGRRPGEGP
jgi:hypothetical protein